MITNDPIDSIPDPGPIRVWDPIQAREKALEAHARRAAIRIGLKAIKSRKGIGSVDNCGHFMIIDPLFNRVEAGVQFEMTAEQVIEYCDK
jgi:hypothetical protein